MISLWTFPIVFLKLEHCSINILLDEQKICVHTHWEIEDVDVVFTRGTLGMGFDLVLYIDHNWRCSSTHTPELRIRFDGKAPSACVDARKFPDHLRAPRKDTFCGENIVRSFSFDFEFVVHRAGKKQSSKEKKSFLSKRKRRKGNSRKIELQHKKAAVRALWNGNKSYWHKKESIFVTKWSKNFPSLLSRNSFVQSGNYKNKSEAKEERKKTKSFNRKAQQNNEIKLFSFLQFEIL